MTKPIITDLADRRGLVRLTDEEAMTLLALIGFFQANAQLLDNLGLRLHDRLVGVGMLECCHAPEDQPDA